MQLKIVSWFKRKKTNPFISQETASLIKDITENHSNWAQGTYCLKNKTTQSNIWTANGMSSIDFLPDINAFNLAEKRALHRAIIKCNISNALHSK